jgi:hypothetical protein
MHVKGVFKIQDQRIVFRRLIALAFLNLLGFTRFDVGNQMDGNLTLAMVAVDQADPATSLNISARLDFSSTRWTTHSTLYNNSFMASFELGSPLPLYRVLRTSLETCLRHIYPMLWVRIQGPRELAEDKRLRSLSNILLVPTADEADLWVLAPPSGGWDAVSYRFQTPSCTKGMLQNTFEDYLARAPYEATLTIYDIPAMTNLMPSQREAVYVRLGDGSRQYQFHMCTCAKLRQILR